MKIFLVLIVLVLSSSALAADVGVSVTVGQPGFYGRIDINNYPYPQPRVIYREPILVERVYVEREPIYMRVPPGHAKKWHKHCHKYNACGERVYFVQDGWYRRDYVPQYLEYHGDHHDAYKENRYDDDDDKHHGKKHKKSKH